MPYTSCMLCAHRCGVDRTKALGRCKMSDQMRVSRIALHPWEEPILTGERGSGTVFFVGCSLGCVYCQNRRISRGEGGEPISALQLAERMLELAAQGAANINLVTPTHFVPSIIESVRYARERGLTLPIVYNTSNYDTSETLRALEGTVDVYLADFKYYDATLAARYSGASNYPEAAKAAIDEMMRQKPSPRFREDGTLATGVICRLLLLPGAVANSKLALSYLYRTYGDRMIYSLMSQYTPVGTQRPPLDRTVTGEEYRDLTEFALRLGIRDAFIQEGGAASESFIPDFY